MFLRLCAAILGAAFFVSSPALAQDDYVRPARRAGELHRGSASVRPGARLYWSDGSPAGRAHARATLAGRLTPRGPSMCFAVPLRPVARPRDADVITLCADRTAISR